MGCNVSVMMFETQPENESWYLVLQTPYHNKWTVGFLGGCGSPGGGSIDRVGGGVGGGYLLGDYYELLSQHNNKTY